MPKSDSIQPVPLNRVVSTWWPLAISWMLMAAEPPLLAAVVARLQDPSIHLAAYGSVTFPLIGILQAPVLTLLSLSTAMSKDWDSFQKGRKLMLYLGGGLTVLYLLIAFTPLYYVIVEGLLGVPPEIVEPARAGMFVGLPWAFAVAYRRFHQGVMIRFDHARIVTVGTMLRFSADAIVLTLALVIGTIPGTVVATGMMVIGVITEAIYVGLRVRPVLRYDLRRVPSLQDKILLRDMVAFFIPLGMTPLLQQLIRPIGSAALSRMADPLSTLAIWPVIAGFSFLIVTPGAAYNEVVIAMLDRPGARPTLQRFMLILIGAQLSIMLLLSLTPLAYIWFSRVSGLPQDLALLASQAFLLLVPSSIISPLNSWFSGALLHYRKSRALTEGMVLYLLIYAVSLIASGRLLDISGIYVAVGSAMLASITQTGWLAFRSRESVRALDRDSESAQAI
jgi:hypothetical protein